jgi:glycosyltransferase involved in cell wall biosynthesis
MRRGFERVICSDQPSLSFYKLENKMNPSVVDVSVVIPTKKRSNLLAAALTSVANQTRKARSIFVIDDNTDEVEAAKTRKVAESFAEHGVVYLKNERTPGGGGARNTGILHSETKYVAFLDDDDLWAEQKLEKQVSYLEKTGACVLFCGYIDRDLSFNQTITVQLDRDQYVLDDFINGRCPTSTTLAIAPKAVLVDAGLFDETLPSLEDFDLWIRCSQIAPIRTMPDILATFIQHKGERVSVDLARHHIALERLMEKLSQAYGIDQKRLDRLRCCILYNISSVAAKRHSLVSVTQSWKFALMAIRNDPFGTKGWKWLMIAPIARLVLRRQAAE